MFVKEPIDWESKIKSLFQPDVLIEVAYFGRFRQRHTLEAEKRLMIAVLEDALACFQRYFLDRRPKGKDLFREAEAWIFEEDDEWPFSFVTICETVGVNPDYIRGGLLRWKKTALRKKFGDALVSRRRIRAQKSAHPERNQNLESQGR